MNSFAVKPRWIYKDNRNNTNSLPDSIHIDLQLESAKITLNLIRIAKSTEAFKKTFFATTLEGQSSNDYDNEVSTTGIVNDMNMNLFVMRNVYNLLLCLFMFKFDNPFVSNKRQFMVYPVLA